MGERYRTWISDPDFNSVLVANGMADLDDTHQTALEELVTSGPIPPTRYSELMRTMGEVSKKAIVRQVRSDLRSIDYGKHWNIGGYDPHRALGDWTGRRSLGYRGNP